MSGTHAQPVHHERPRYQWWVYMGIGLGAVVLGLWGYWRPEFELAERNAGTGPLPLLAVISSVAYDTLLLFVLHPAHVEGAFGWRIEWAKWLAATLSLWTVTGALRRVYAMELRHFRLGFSRDHVVVCGAGWRGLPLAVDFARSEAAGGSRDVAERVIVIEKDPGAHGIAVCEKLGIPYLVADASDPGVLKRAGVQRARILVAACAEDGTNLEVAIHAGHLARALRPKGAPLRCFLHIANLDLRTAVRRRSFLSAADGRMEISTFGFDVYENSARLLFDEHPLDWKPIMADSPVQVHLLVIGLGEMGENVLIQAARIGQFANGRKVRVTVVDRAASARAADLKERYPQLDQVCDLDFKALEARDPAVSALAAHITADPANLLTCAICLPDGALNLALALKLADERAFRESCSPIRVRVPTRSGLTLLLSEDRQDALFCDRISPFGMREDVCNRRTLEEPQMEAIARAFHEDYVRRETSKSPAPAGNTSLVPWEELPDDLKRSNYHAADHAEVKIRAVGLRVANSPQGVEPVTAFTPEEIEVLSRMEHHRFCAERLLGGWRYDTSGKDPVNKTNPTLVPWAALSEGERDKDREQVREIPQIFASAGRVVCR